MSLSRAYLVIGLTAVSSFAAMVAPFQTPDEMAHLWKIAALAEGRIISHHLSDDQIAARVIHKPGDSFGSKIDTGVLMFSRTGYARTPPAPIDSSMAQNLEKIEWGGGQSIVAFPNTAQYGPAFYAVQAVLLRIWRQFDPVVLDAYLIVRWVTAALAVSIAATALAITRRGRLGLFIMLCTPGVLYLATSVGQEGFVVATAALLGALLTRIDEPGARPWALLFAILLGMARPPYVLLSLLLVRDRDWSAPSVAFGLTIAWLYVSGTLTNTTPLVVGADARSQLAFLFAHPGAPLMIAFHQLADPAVPAMGLVGFLGMLTIALPEWCYQLGYVALGLAVIASLPGRSAGWALPVTILSAGGVAFALYLTWTPVGSLYLDGMQGRYLTPLLIVLLPNLPAAPASWSPACRWAGISGAVVMLVVLGQSILTVHRIFAF